jgi:DNA polymerase-1
LREAKPIPSDHKRGTALAIVGEAPGGLEVHRGRYFVGESGKRLNNGFRHFGIPPHRVHINNTLQCRPPYDFGPKDWKRAIACCQPRLEAELREANPRVILAVGKKALHALSIYNSDALFPFVGSTLDCGLKLKRKQTTLLVSLHPAFCLRGQRQYFPVFYQHLQHAWELATGARDPFQWQRLLYYGDSEIDILKALKKFASAKSGKLGIDIETGGSDPVLDGITALGLGDYQTAVSVLWPPERHFVCEDRARQAFTLIRQSLANPRTRKVAHNGIHDVIGLEAIGLNIAEYTDDTILKHHVVANTLKHSLGFVAQTEFACEPWKKLFHVGGDEKGLARFLTAPGEELTLYNAKDTAILSPLDDRLDERLATVHNGQELYDGYLERSKIAMAMQLWGIHISPKAVAAHEKPLRSRIARARAEVRKVAKSARRSNFGTEETRVPWQRFNPGSKAQLRRLLFESLKVRPAIYTSTGLPSLREEVLQSLVGHHRAQVQYLARALLRYNRYTKLYNTYIKGLRGVTRAHPQAKVWGTKTGRWSYDIFPAQTTPKKLRDVVIASPGNWLLSADYSQLEMRIMALLSGDPRLMEWFIEGKDPHTETAIGLFGSLDHLSKKKRTKFRDVAKTFNYGEAYGGDDKTLWTHVNKKLPDLGISLLDVMRIRETKAMMHPVLVQWRRDLLAKAERDDFVEHPLSGRRIYFHGDVEATKVYNSPIQGTAADIINAALPGVFKGIKRIKGSSLIFQVHDELVADVSDPLRGARVLKRHMTKPITIDGKKMHFPIDYKIGRDWGLSMKKFESIEEIEKWWKKQKRK